MKISYIYKKTYASIHSSCTHTSQKVKLTQMSINQINKLWNSHMKVYYSAIKENNKGSGKLC